MFSQRGSCQSRSRPSRSRRLRLSEATSASGTPSPSMLCSGTTWKGGRVAGVFQFAPQGYTATFPRPEQHNRTTTNRGVRRRPVHALLQP